MARGRPALGGKGMNQDDIAQLPARALALLNLVYRVDQRLVEALSLDSQGLMALVREIEDMMGGLFDDDTQGFFAEA